MTKKGLALMKLGVLMTIVTQIKEELETMAKQVWLVGLRAKVTLHKAPIVTTQQKGQQARVEIACLMDPDQQQK
jgi:cobalamin biosynthesis protein CbiD